MKLANCPHCNGKAYLNQRYSWRQNQYIVFAKCEVCGSQGKIYASREEPAAAGWNNEPCQSAAAAWNMRYKEDE